MPESGRHARSLRRDALGRKGFDDGAVNRVRDVMFDIANPLAVINRVRRERNDVRFRFRVRLRRQPESPSHLLRTMVARASG
jgi:hypothetical protein